MAEIIASSLPQGHQEIERIEILEAPVTQKQLKKKDKKKKKQDEEGEEEKEEIDPAGPPQFLNITLKTEFIEQ